jgi:hypothetical protein
MSTSESLNQEPITHGHYSSDKSIPPADETISSLNDLKEDFGKLSNLKTKEDRIINDLFSALMKLTQLLQYAPIKSSILQEDLGKVERAHVTPEGTLIVYHEDGEIETIDLSEYEKRDVLVKVVRDIAPKLREVFERSPKSKEPIEELEPVVEMLTTEELKIEIPVIQKPILEEDVEFEDTFTEPIIEEKPILEEPEFETEKTEELEKKIVESVKPEIFKPLIIEKPLIEKPQIIKEPVKKKHQKESEKDPYVNILRSVLIGLRKNSFREIKIHRTKIEKENSKLLKNLRKKKDQKLVKQSFFDQFKILLKKRKKKNE